MKIEFLPPLIQSLSESIEFSQKQQVSLLFVPVLFFSGMKTFYKMEATQCQTKILSVMCSGPSNEDAALPAAVHSEAQRTFVIQNKY